MVSENIYWLSEDCGISHSKRFYKTLSLRTNAQFKVQAVLREIFYLLTLLFEAVTNNSFSVAWKYTSLTTEKTDKKALVVLFHGLNTGPSTWNAHVKQFEKEAVEIYVPIIPSKGHCALNDPRLIEIFNTIEKWTVVNHGLPVLLYGHSNGTRIALQEEVRLREKSPTTPVQLTLIAGPLYGTTFVGKIKKFSPVLLGLLTDLACQQLDLGGQENIELLRNARAPLGSGVADRSYKKYASMHDVFVPEIGSSFPELNPTNDPTKHEDNTPCYGYGHGSVVSSTADQQIADSLMWLEKRVAV